MHIVARSQPNTPTPPPWRTSLAAGDQHAVTYLPAETHLGECRFCPPADPTHPAVAALLYLDHRAGIRTLPVGQLCGATALHHLLGGGPVTVLTPQAAGR